MKVTSSNYCLFQPQGGKAHYLFDVMSQWITQEIPDLKRQFTTDSEAVNMWRRATSLSSEISSLRSFFNQVIYGSPFGGYTVCFRFWIWNFVLLILFHKLKNPHLAFSNSWDLLESSVYASNALVSPHFFKQFREFDIVMVP